MSTFFDYLQRKGIRPQGYQPGAGPSTSLGRPEVQSRWGDTATSVMPSGPSPRVAVGMEHRRLPSPYMGQGDGTGGPSPMGQPFVPSGPLGVNAMPSPTGTTEMNRRWPPTGLRRAGHMDQDMMMMLLREYLKKVPYGDGLV